MLLIILILLILFGGLGYRSGWYGNAPGEMPGPIGLILLVVLIVLLLSDFGFHGWYRW
jgi:hypothetical protein